VSDRSPAEAALDRAAAMLGELFDSVLILTTIEAADGTDSHHRLRGNTFASEGAARRWLQYRVSLAARMDAEADADADAEMNADDEE
jgi:hypothetical protein